MTGDLTLAGLIDLAFDRHSVRSGAALARIAQGLGHKIVVTTINHVRAGTYKPKPSKATLQAIAALAGVPLNVAYDAANLPAPGPSLSDQVSGVEGGDYLTAEERDLVLRLVRLLAARHEAGEEGMFGPGVGEVAGGVSEMPRLSLPSSGQSSETPTGGN